MYELKNLLKNKFFPFFCFLVLVFSNLSIINVSTAVTYDITQHKNINFLRVKDRDNSVKNIIYFIGDGMGPTHVVLARNYSLFILGKDLNMTSLMKDGSTAYMTNYSADYIVTDSAAAGTAMATGFKTNNGMISVTPDGRKIDTILEKAQSVGKSTGLISTARLTDATPASFSSHSKNRGLENEIAVDMLEHKVDCLLGGGLRHFIPQDIKGSGREDIRNLLTEAQNFGYTVVKNAREFNNADPYTTSKLLGLFSISHLPYELDRNTNEVPSLAEMTEKALQILNKNQTGFFLMVEGGRIDHAAHANDAASVIKEVLAFDEAIGVALNYQKKEPNTLIVVTADHETGGIAITKGQPIGESFDYMTKNDLNKFTKISASIEDVIVNEVKKAQSISAIKEIIKKYTDIDITDDDALGIKEGKAWMPNFSNQPANWIGRAVSNELKVTFATGDHTAEPIMLFAMGPYSEIFTGFLDNTDVPKIMSHAFGLDIETVSVMH